MLASFSVPHAHYRVFHGNPAADSLQVTTNEQFPLIFNPKRIENVSTDLHLREFAQLEVQVKALQLQVIQHVYPNAMENAVAGSISECLLFYSRLFTVESFPWPDFLAAVFTKLAEHFATSGNSIVRSAILRAFQRATAHLAQVNDASKLLSHLSGPLTHATCVTTRTLTLQMLATMPSLVVSDMKMMQRISTGLTADDRDEQSAAIEAVNAVLALSSSFRKDVLTLSLQKSTKLCCLLPGAVSNQMEAQQAWIHCAELYERLADDKSAVASIRAMTALTAAYPRVLLMMHGQLLHHVLGQDPRSFVRNFALIATQQLVEKLIADGEDQLANILEGMFSQISIMHATSSRGMMRIKLSALFLLKKWCVNNELGEKALALLHDANKLLAFTSDTRFGKVYVSIMLNIARQKLSSAETTLPEHHVDSLLELLHPRAAVAAKSTWNYALSALAGLCQDFPQHLAVHVSSRLVELLSIPTENLDSTISKLRRASVLKVLGAQLRPPLISVIQKELPMLLKELSTIKKSDAPHLQAVAATFFLWTQDLTFANTDEDKGTSKTIVEIEQQLVNPEYYESHAERYEMVKLAMLRGRFSLALQLLEAIAARADNECFGGWLRALQALCEAESRIVSEQFVHLDSVHSLARTSMYLHAAQTSSFRFDLQLCLVSLRLEWVQILQSTRQLAAEAAFTNSVGSAAGREGQLSKQLRALAHKLGVLRSSLLGASQRDLDVLQAHANSCLLLASAIEGFLLLWSPNSIEFPTKWGLNMNGSQWSLEKLKILSEDVRGKLDRVVKLAPFRQPGIGARVLQQLLAALCTVPLVLPKVFFCSRLHRKQCLLSSAQFLTYAENATFTAKPRSRSQLGVSLGTDFTSVLKGVLALPRSAQDYWSEQIEAIEAEILVCLAGVTRVSNTTTSSSIDEMVVAASQEEKFVQYRAKVNLPVLWDHVAESAAIKDGDGQTMIYLPFQAPVHVKATNLSAKGSFVLTAKLAVVDRQGERWPLAATGCRRGFIVY
ncbi:unnamed protein product [Peronospora belbahrii]|uniref:Integrator complex subunit 7 N-terminal domain-containing protein n=1 Tax=Peronospora belbahrii TaxID=622444 RepID=A0AAU9LDW1_9STRA|nr:unnamed protein product [Peronospora belbahrii]CAH0521875.1 unnamed protein product [Peronospora belbahrii]